MVQKRGERCEKIPEKSPLKLVELFAILKHLEGTFQDQDDDLLKYKKLFSNFQTALVEFFLEKNSALEFFLNNVC
jgi:hypothetical protein